MVTVTFRVPFAPHPPDFVTTTLSVIVPGLPARKEMLRVPAPPVIVPFVIVQTYVAPVPADATDAEPVLFDLTLDGAVMVADGSAVVETFFVPLFAQPAPLTTVTPSATVPEGPALNVTFREPAPPVIVPFVIVQVYVAPAPASSTEAAFPTEDAQTEDGAVMVADGRPLTATLVEPPEAHPAEVVTVTVSPTEPEAGELNVIARVPAPAVIVPPVMAHAYVAPAPASGTDATLPVELGQTAGGAVIAADGAALTATLCEPLAAQPEPFCTVTPRLRGPAAPAVKPIVRVPAPLVIVPFVIVHA